MRALRGEWVLYSLSALHRCLAVVHGGFWCKMGLCLFKNCCWFSSFQELMFLEVIPRFQESWYSNRFGTDFKLSCPSISNKWKDLDSSQTSHWSIFLYVCDTRFFVETSFKQVVLKFNLYMYFFFTGTGTSNMSKLVVFESLNVNHKHLSTEPSKIHHRAQWSHFCSLKVLGFPFVRWWWFIWLTDLKIPKPQKEQRHKKKTAETCNESLFA